MNRKTTLSNFPLKLYCHTKVILLPSKTLNGSGGVAVNLGTNSTKQNKKNDVNSTDPLTSFSSNTTRRASSKLFCATRETLAQ